MVAEELVELDEISAVLLEPGRVVHVELDACSLRERVVRRVTDQQVAEAEPVVSRDVCPIGPDQLLADERGEHGCHGWLVGGECLDGTSMEHFALHRRPFEHPALRRLEPVETGGEHRAERRGHDHVARALRHRKHLLDEQRVPARRQRDLASELERDALGDQLHHMGLVERTESQRDGPARPQLRELGACDTEQEDRPPGRQQRHVLDEVEECLLAPLDVVEDDHQRLVRGGALERLAKGPCDLVGGGGVVALAEQGPNRSDGRLVGRKDVELLQHLDDRPVRDALAVGQAATVDHPSAHQPDSLRHEPRLADSRVTDDRDQLAPRLIARAFPGAPQRLQLLGSADESSSVRSTRCIAYPKQPERRDRLRLALQHERLDRLGVGRVPDEGERRLSDQHLSG